MTKKPRQKYNLRTFSNEIKSIFHRFKMAFIKENKKGENPTLSWLAGFDLFFSVFLNRFLKYPLILC